MCNYILINWKVEPSEPAQMTKEFMEDMVKLTSYKDPVYDEVMKAVGHIQPQKMVHCNSIYKSSL